MFSHFFKKSTPKLFFVEEFPQVYTVRSYFSRSGVFSTKVSFVIEDGSTWPPATSRKMAHSQPGKPTNGTIINESTLKSRVKNRNSAQGERYKILLMEEIPNNHLGCIKPCKWWDKLPFNWCRISSINSMYLNPPVGFEIWATQKATKNRPFVAKIWQPNERSRERLFTTFSANDPEPHEGTVPFIYICLTLIVTIILCVCLFCYLQIYFCQPTQPQETNPKSVFQNVGPGWFWTLVLRPWLFATSNLSKMHSTNPRSMCLGVFFWGRCNQVVWWSSYYKLHPRKPTWNLDFTPQKKRRNIDPKYHFLGWKAVCFSGPVHV